MTLLGTKKVLTLDGAKKLAAAAHQEAKKNGWSLAIAIVDDGGHLLYLERMDGTQIGSIGVAISKAETAARFRRPTKLFEEAVAGGRQVVMSLTGVLPIEGGVPVVVDGEIVGAVGASGGTAAQDGAVAFAGASAI
jgi:uncharacterized protein GlcG (DUF336 family)